MEAVLTRLKSLSADELREEFARVDLKCGPITATTRALFERKLARVLAGPEISAPEMDNSSLTVGDTSTDQIKHMSCTTSLAAPANAESPSSSRIPPQAVSEELDFGYGMGLNPPEEEEEEEEEEISVKLSTSANISAEGSCSQPTAGTPSKPSQVSPTFFYGVCPLWEDVLARNEKTHIYTDKKEALHVVKMMKGARFKAFSSREDAEKFAKGMCDYYPTPNKSTACVSPIKPGPVIYRDNMEVDTINRERANSFKSPRTQDLTAKLRKAVEKGDELTFSELVWSNPRYLIGSGDNPTIVQEGCRYNVMHVAAKENQAGIAQLLLDTLENPEFMRLMYPDDQDAMLQKRIRYIVDLYLNTPDKAGFETPLHFACKFGCPEVVNVLCSHPDIDKNSKNKYDQKPCEVICERRTKTQDVKEVKQKILDYLEDRCYIPLLRATDNSSQPIIGAPWSPEPSENLSHPLAQRHVRSPMDPVMTVKAFAGPLSPSKADEFRRAWKTPPRDRAEHFHHILKSDPDRGAERVGRDLAHELGHPWSEYWDFLDSFVDLSSTEGLRKLEEYLKKKDFSQRAHEEAGENETSNRFRTPSPGKSKKFCNSISVGAFLDEGDDISLEELKNRQNAALTSITSTCSKDGLKGAAAGGGPEFHILPVPPHRRGADLIEAAAERDSLCRCSDRLLSPAGACPNGPCSPVAASRDRTPSGEQGLLSPMANLLAQFDRMSLQELEEQTPGGDGSQHSISTADLSAGLGRLVLSRGCRGDDLAFDTAAGKDRRGSSSSEEYFEAREGPLVGPVEGLGQRTRGGADGRTFCARSKSWDHGGRDLSSSTSSGSSGSYRSLDNSHEFLPRTPPRISKGLFIDGVIPTKLDREVLSAMEAIDLDSQKYPSIHKWKSTMETYSLSDMQSWPSPAVARPRPRLQPHTPGSPGSSFTSPAGRFSPARHAASPDFSPSHYSPAHASYIQRIRLKHFPEPPV